MKHIYWKYLKYVLRHKWFVFIECAKRGIIWRGITHDLSKFYPDEFIPYARYFYGNCPESFQTDFDKAWLKHIHRNPHHWQYWILREDDGGTKLIRPPLQYLKEMGCDWVGAGKAITGMDNITEWYDRNKDKIQIGKIQRDWIEKEFINKKQTERKE
jgi:hypothetical protein